jgi:molybdopterin-guanine dinucleotide biosynthesis protein A
MHAFATSPYTLTARPVRKTMLNGPQSALRVKTKRTHYVYLIIAVVSIFGCYYSSMRRAGFILTGGSSSRMGRDKALLPWGDSTVVEHLARLLLAGTVTLIGQPQRYRHLAISCIPDLRPGWGPLGGIEAALASADTDAACLILACDIPGVAGQWLVELFRRAESGNSLFTGIRDATGAFHPLCAVYLPQSLAIIQGALDSGERRLLQVVDRLNPAWIDAPDVLANINTSEEWQAACSR